MLKRPQQFALFKGAQAESVVAADEALARLDPLLRWLARRRVRRFSRMAERETIATEPGHRWRLAYLLGAGERLADPDDVQLVAARFSAALPPDTPGRSGAWLSAALLGALVVMAGLVLGLKAWSRPFSPKGTPAGQLLGGLVTEYVVALSRGDAEAAGAARELLTSRSQKVLGPESSQGLDAVTGSMLRLVTSQGEPPKELIREYEQGVVRLDATLSRAGHPYFLDAELRGFRGRVQPILMSYYVQSEASVAGSDPGIRVVRLWRLDELNIAQGALGFTRPHTPAAIVLLDQVEESLVKITLPAAAPSGRVELVDEATREGGEPWVAEVEEDASKVTLAYYRSLGPPLADEAVRIGTLLLRRRTLVRKWQASMRGMGVELAVPRRLFPEIDYDKELWLKIPKSDLKDWRLLHVELKERLSGFEKLRERFVQSVEHHEVQHRLDYARGGLPVPEFLCQLLRCQDRTTVAEGTLLARARDEASAYLAQLARAEDSPVGEMVLLASFMLDSTMQQQAAPYSYAAVTVYVALARALGVDVDAVLGRGSIGRSQLARLARIVWERPPAELKAAAEKAYEVEFGAALPAVRIEARRHNAPYRPEHERELR